jgi:hypothetical protein
MVYETQQHLTLHDVRNLVLPAVEAEGGGAELNVIRWHIARLNPQKAQWQKGGHNHSSGELTGRFCGQVYTALNELVIAGKLVKFADGERKPSGATSGVWYYTEAALEKAAVEREHARQARAEVRAAWEEVCGVLTNVVGLDFQTDSQGRPDLDLDTWQALTEHLV